MSTHAFKKYFKNSKPFGGLSLIAWGDLFQLKPVGESYIFKNANSGYAPLATNLWTDFFSMYELNQVMRQKDIEFAQTLNRLRQGNQTPQDIAIINSCVIGNNLQPGETDHTHLFLSNALVEQYNQDRYNEAN
jgi:hypothetical protein